jgi:hypothetical protein
MGEIYKGILRLMDILGGVDLFWRQNYDEMAGSKHRNTAGLIALADLLDGQVNDVGFLRL